MNSKTFLADLKTANSQLTTVKTEMTAMQTGFEPPPDPDKPGLLAQLNQINATAASITSIANALIASINAS